MIFALLLPLSWGLAGELPEHYRGVRALGMGNAFTAVADDEDSVFYNPAGLSQLRYSRLNLLNPKIDASRDDYTSVQEISDAAKQFDANAISKLFGKNIYAAGSAFPNIAFPHFLVGYLYQADFHLNVRNKSLPRFDARYIIDNGLVAGTGLDFRGFSSRHYLRVGADVKWISRRGFDTTIPISKLLVADKEYFKSLSRGPSMGVGVGLGVQYEIPISRFDDFVLGSCWQDIGDTTFANRFSQDSAPPRISENLSAGGAWVHRFGTNSRGRNNLKIAAEARNLTVPNRDPRLKAHMGAELELGALSLRVGLNDMAYAAGVGVDLWLLKISAATYAVENQTLAYMDRERRYILQVDFGIGLEKKTARTKKEEDQYKHPR